MSVYAHGPLHGQVAIAGASTVTASVSPLYERQFFDVRVLVPAEAFAAMPADGREALQAILAEEARWAEESDRRRAAARARREERARQSETARRFLPVSILLGLVALATWFVYFRRYGWPHHVSVHVAPGQPPSDRAPALVSYLVTRTVGGPALVATLVDLAERGHLAIKETTREKSGWFGSSSTQTDYRFERTSGGDALQTFEKNLLDFAVTEVGDGRAFTMSGFKKFASKHRSRVRRWFTHWSKQVKDAGKREHFFEPYDTSAVLVNVGMGVAVTAGGIAVSVVTSSPVGVPAIAGGVAQAILSLTFTRHTPEARREMVAWGRFREHLKSVSKGMGKITLTSHEWSRYVAAAIIFGLHEKLLPSLRLEGAAGHPVVPVWYAGLGGGGGADGIHTMVSTVASTMTSSTGAGGGASVGGGGGGGGGSAGAS
jgi:uncharacterized membrane protein